MGALGKRTCGEHLVGAYSWGALGERTYCKIYMSVLGERTCGEHLLSALSERTWWERREEISHHNNRKERSEPGLRNARGRDLA